MREKSYSTGSHKRGSGSGSHRSQLGFGSRVHPIDETQDEAEQEGSGFPKMGSAKKVTPRGSSKFDIKKTAINFSERFLRKESTLGSQRNAIYSSFHTFLSNKKKTKEEKETDAKNFIKTNFKNLTKVLGSLDPDAEENKGSKSNKLVRIVTPLFKPITVR